MKIFVLGLSHAPTTVEFNTCAFAIKIRNLCKMLYDRGHEVIHLGVESSNPVCTENVDIAPYDMWKKLYGHPGKDFYTTDFTGKFAPYQKIYVDNAKKAIKERVSKKFESILCVTWGDTQKNIANEMEIPQLVVESGIGHRHTFAQYRVFESYSWMHMIHGAEDHFNGSMWYDVVIPLAVDPDMFSFREKKQDYFLFMGRLNDDKGVHIACDVADRVGVPLKILGQGNPERFLKGRKMVTYYPPANVEERRELMANARAFFCPTTYVEPFGAVAIEAQISGTPVICTDWGGFTETVLHGTTGYRCRTMEQFEWAARNIDRISPHACHNWAYHNFKLDRIALMYEEYFQSILNLDGQGWYSPNPNRSELRWLTKVYP